MHPDDPFIVRVGVFFLVMGGGAFILFVASDFADRPDFDYLFAALILFAIGWSMWRQKPPPPDPGRFSWLKRRREAARQRRADRFKAKQEARK
jgi:hypothetical protein